MTTTDDKVRAEFERHYGKMLSLTKAPDAWGVPQYEHPHVFSIWTGWRDHAIEAAKLSGGAGEPVDLDTFICEGIKDADRKRRAIGEVRAGTPEDEAAGRIAAYQAGYQNGRTSTYQDLAYVKLATPPVEPAVVPAADIFDPREIAIAEHVRACGFPASVAQEIRDGTYVPDLSELEAGARAMQSAMLAVPADDQLRHSNPVVSHDAAVGDTQPVPVADDLVEIVEADPARGTIKHLTATIAGKDAEIAEHRIEHERVAQLVAQRTRRAQTAEARITDLQAEVGRAKEEGYVDGVEAAAKLVFDNRGIVGSTNLAERVLDLRPDRAALNAGERDAQG